MDDFTKKDKYSSLNSAIKEIVSQNNDLYQKSLREKYGFKDEQPVKKTEVSEEVEQLDEAKMIAVQAVYPAKMVKDLKSARIPAQIVSDDEVGINIKYAEGAINWMIRKGGWDFQDIKDLYPELVKAAM